MSGQGELRSRGEALRETVFQPQDQSVGDWLCAAEEAELRRKALAAVSGISDDTLLERLIELDLDAGSVAAVALVPLVQVAWADGGVQEQERQAILRAAGEAGLASDTPGYQLLQGWLGRPPSAKLLEAWRDYVKALTARLGGEQQRQLHDQVLGRARQVAAAAGGFLGIASISAEEQAVLDELEAAFSDGQRY